MGLVKHERETADPEAARDEEGGKLIPQLLMLGIIFAVILIAPPISHKLGLPVIVFEVSSGILLGKSLLNLVAYDAWLGFLADFGLIYLLFLAGLEMGVKEFRKKSLLVAVASLALPFTFGSMLGWIMLVDPLFLGALLSTTSVGVVLPTLREIECRREFKRLSLESALLVDAFSMFLLMISLEIARGTPMTFLALSLLFALSLFSLPIITRRYQIGQRLSEWSEDKPHFEYEVRFCLALIVFLVIAFEFLGFHAILGSFLAGLIVSELTEKGGLLEKRLMSFGYGFFIPIFFIAIGITMNVSALFKIRWLLILILLFIAGVLGKVIGVTGAGKLIGLSNRESLTMGFLHSARLSLILAGAKIGWDLGFLTEATYSMIILFAMVTVLICPSIGRTVMGRRT